MPELDPAVARVAYDEAVRSADLVNSNLDHLRDRALGLLTFASGILAAFAITDVTNRWFLAAGGLPFLTVILAVLGVIWPRRWAYRPAPGLEDFARRGGLYVGQVYLDLAKAIEAETTHNEFLLNDFGGIAFWFRIGVVGLGAMVTILLAGAIVGS